MVPTIELTSQLGDIDWTALKQALACDDFDNGRSPEQLCASFQNSFAASFARLGGETVGTARLLSDGVCNAYLVDVWTRSDLRRRGVARAMVNALLSQVSGQHVYLQSDADTLEFYRRLGFDQQPTGMSTVVGVWLGAEQTRSDSN